MSDWLGKKNNVHLWVIWDIKNIIDYKGYGELFTLVTTSNGLEFPIDRNTAEQLKGQGNVFITAKADVLLRSVEQHLVK